jgi:hypothetical protein
MKPGEVSSILGQPTSSKTYFGFGRDGKESQQIDIFAKGTVVKYRVISQSDKRLFFVSGTTIAYFGGIVARTGMPLSAVKKNIGEPDRVYPPRTSVALGKNVLVGQVDYSDCRFPDKGYFSLELENECVTGCSFFADLP